MRLWPRSIASRTALVLIAGVLIVLWVGVMVWWWSVVRDDGPPGTRIGFESVASVAVMVDRLSPGARAAALERATTDAFKLVWSTDRPARPLLRRGWESRWGRPPAKAIVRRCEGFRPWRWGFRQTAHAAAIVCSKRTSGSPPGSWLTISGREEVRGPPRPLAFLGVIALVALGLAGLAILISRRVTAPLRRFSAAASRLGTDVDAPPMDESGPTETRDAAEAFNQMQRRIRRFVEDRTRMLAAISHDLRTMLTRFRLRADYIDDEEQRAKAVADLNRMREMLDATLSFARDDAAAEPTTSVDLSSLLQTLCDDLADAGHEGRLYRAGSGDDRRAPRCARSGVCKFDRQRNQVWPRRRGRVGGADRRRGDPHRRPRPRHSGRPNASRSSRHSTVWRSRAAVRPAAPASAFRWRATLCAAMVGISPWRIATAADWSYA